MVKREAHIDIVFRNGLKNLEILPPADLWEDIAPAISARREASLFFRVAAGVAALVSLGLLSYFAGIQSPSSLADADFSGSMDIVPLKTDIRFTADAGTPASDRSNAVVMNHAEVSSETFEGNSTVAGRTAMPDPLPLPSPGTVTSARIEGNIVRNREEAPETIPVAITGSFEDITLIPRYVEELPSNPENRWRVGAQVSPTYLSSNLKTENQRIGELVSNENSLLSYSGGISFSYNMGNRLSIQTGVYYSSLGREIEGISSYSGFAEIAGSKSGRVFGIETTAGTINTTNRDMFLTDNTADRIQSIYTADNFDPLKADLIPFGSSLQQSFEYLEIPFMLNYKVIDRKIGFNIMGGVSYNFLLGNTAYVVGDGSKVAVGSTEDVSRLLLSSALGMNIEYALTNKFMLNVGPSMRYYLNSGGSFSGDNPYTFGLFSGLFFKF